METFRADQPGRRKKGWAEARARPHQWLARPAHNRCMGGHTHETAAGTVDGVAGAGTWELSEGAWTGPDRRRCSRQKGHVTNSPAGDDAWDRARAGDYVVIPPQRHSLQGSTIQW